MSGIRLINVVPTLLCGGTETQFMTLARALDPGRFDVRFACLRQLGQFVDELSQRGMPLREYRVSTFCSVDAVRQQLKFARDVRREAIDIVHTYSFYGNVFGIPAGRVAAPVVVASVRDRGLYLTPMQTRVQRHLCRLADRVLVNAVAVKSWLVDQGFPASRIIVIPNGVDLRRFNRRVEPAALRQSLGLSRDARLVAVVSRLHRLKGIEDFLDAAVTVAATHPDARFLVVGQPSPVDNVAYLDELSQRARRLGIGDRVIFTGLRDDVPELLSAVDVSVMPSLNEALSNVLLESMAAGAPVVATDVGGTTEALQHERNGLLIPAANPGAMAAAIERLLSNPSLARDLGARARQSIADKFSLDRMVAATAAVYEDLLVRKQRRPVAPAEVRAIKRQQGTA
ncbi:MAG: glycosyltransferase [Vicinamibacterales bacterium]